LEVAANDVEAMVQENLWQKKEICKKLEQVFLVVDSSGDGFISPEEFEDVVSIPQVRGFFETIDIEVGEIQALFSILDDGDGQISYNEFIQGVMRLKGQARSMDVIAMMRDIKRVIEHIKAIEHLIGQELGVLEDLESSWPDKKNSKQQNSQKSPNGCSSLSLGHVTGVTDSTQTGGSQGLSHLNDNIMPTSSQPVGRVTVTSRLTHHGSMAGGLPM